MDSVAEIKARLPIEELVAKYAQLHKKGRNFVCLCPFHNDTHPSLLVSPDKGIAYCFACQKGGDIFSFYQQIEGCDFKQALVDLAERAGVVLEKQATAIGPKKDEKDRARECLQEALSFYREQFKTAKIALDYAAKRQLTQQLLDDFEIGYSPDSFSLTYEHLLKKGFSRKEILSAGLGVQKDLREERIYDRFRNRLMFPIHDHQGNIVGFGGRTLGQDDAKYVNTSEGILYHKSQILYGLHRAKEAIREKKKVILVEGYFDVIACHRVGMTNVVAVSGTALTDEHCKLIKRYAETVALCLDQDRAGQDAAERAFKMLAAQEMLVQAVALPNKDPDEVALSDAPLLTKLLSDSAIPYVDHALAQIKSLDLNDAIIRRAALHRILDLLTVLPSAVDQTAYITKAAGAFGTTETALKEDLQHMKNAPPIPISPSGDAVTEAAARDAFTRTEIALALFLLYPNLRNLLAELIAPDETFSATLYAAIKSVPEEQPLNAAEFDLSPENRERLSILQLFAEFHGFADWGESLAVREIRKSCALANREMLQKKQKDLSRQLIAARSAGRVTEEAQLSTQYLQVLKLSKMAS